MVAGRPSARGFAIVVEMNGRIDFLCARRRNNAADPSPRKVGQCETARPAQRRSGHLAQPCSPDTARGDRRAARRTRRDASCILCSAVMIASSSVADLDRLERIERGAASQVMELVPAAAGVVGGKRYCPITDIHNRLCHFAIPESAAVAGTAEGLLQTSGKRATHVRSPPACRDQSH